MRIKETPDRLVYETTLVEFLLVGTPLQVGSLVFDRNSRSVRIHRGFLRKTVLEIPYAAIRRVRHWLTAACYVVLGECESTYTALPYPCESSSSQLSLDLHGQGGVVLYRRDLRMRRYGRDGRDVIPIVQRMADRISAFTGIPGVIVADEIQGSFDCGSKSLILHGERLREGLRGVAIPFRELRALRSTKTAKGYYAAEICRKDGDVILANEGFDSTSRLHETVELIARSAGIPFELQTADRTPPNAGRPYTPISPTFRGSTRMGKGGLR